MSSKKTPKEVMAYIENFVRQEDENICFGFVANVKTFQGATFAKGSFDDVAAMLCAEMGRNKEVRQVVKAAYEVFFKVSLN